MEIEVKGHSGCQIEIVNGGDSLFINKSTHDKSIFLGFIDRH